MSPQVLAGIHHVGITVVEMEQAIAFWQNFVGATVRDRRVLQGPQLGRLTGYDGARIDSCWLDLPGGIALELLDYLQDRAEPYDPGTAHPGNVHLCFEVADMPSAHAHAVACGAQPVSPQPIVVMQGPRAGTQVAYLRAPNGVTVELHQPAQGVT